MSQKETLSTETNKKSRIITFDLLRGYFMLSIIVNHLQWFPSGYDIVAMQGALNVSAAEGFFFLSGLVLGIVRGRKLLAQPFQKAATLLLKRGALLYVTSVVLTFLFMMIGWWFFIDNPGLKPGIRPIDEPIGDVIIGILSYNYLYGWADFLRLYAIFILAAPFALLLLRKGLWYILLAASIGLWMLFPVAFNNGSQSGEILMVLSWQLIFFGGFIVGFYWEKLESFWKSLSRLTQKRILYPVLAVAVVTLLLNIILEVTLRNNILPQPINGWYTAIAPFFFKEELSLARIILFLLWFTLGFSLFKRFEAPVQKFAGWLLLPFGKNSLYVYILHAVILFFAHLLIPAGDSPSILVSFLGTTLIIAIIYLAVRKRFLFKIIPR